MNELNQLTDESAEDLGFRVSSFVPQSTFRRFHLNFCMLNTPILLQMVECDVVHDDERQTDDIVFSSASDDELTNQQAVSEPVFIDCDADAKKIYDMFGDGSTEVAFCCGNQCNRRIPKELALRHRYFNLKYLFRLMMQVQKNLVSTLYGGYELCLAIHSTVKSLIPKLYADKVKKL